MIVLEVYDGIYYALDIVINEALEDPSSVDGFVAKIVNLTGVSMAELTESSSGNLSRFVVTGLKEAKFWAKIIVGSSQIQSTG